MRVLIILLVHLIATLAGLRGPGRTAICRGRISLGQASTADSQSLAAAVAEPASVGGSSPASVGCLCAPASWSARRLGTDPSFKSGYSVALTAGAAAAGAPGLMQRFGSRHGGFQLLRRG